MTVRLGISSTDFTLRGNAYDGVIHFYLKRDLADPAMLWLRPWCQFNSSYPDRHPREELVLHGWDDLRWCPVCTRVGQS